MRVIDSIDQNDRRIALFASLIQVLWFSQISKPVLWAIMKNKYAVENVANNEELGSLIKGEEFRNAIVNLFVYVIWLCVKMKNKI